MSKSTTNLKFIAFSRVTFGFKEHPIKHCGVILVKKCVSLGQEFRSLHDQYPNWIICFVPHKLPQSGFESWHNSLPDCCSWGAYKSLGHTCVWPKLLYAPRAGFEPATNWLTVNCSTAELPRKVLCISFQGLFSPYELIVALLYRKIMNIQLGK